MNRTLPFCLAAFASLASLSPARAQHLVNIDATLYGFAFPTDPAPLPGQLISPFSLTPDGKLNQITLSAGTYEVTNGAGKTGANPDFVGWRYNSNENWVWNYVIADDSTDRVVQYGEAGQVRGSQRDVANDPAVQNYSAQFTLTTTTTLDFMIRDYYLPDNAGGVALYIQPVSNAVPEPGPLALLVGGLMSGSLLLRRRCAVR